jgi:hypothetical protein
LSDKDLFTEKSKRKKNPKAFGERREKTSIKKNATRLNIQIQNNVVLKGTDLREF